MGADDRSFLWRLGVAFALALAAVCGAGTARAQVPGHLNVPGSQMIHAGFTPMPGLPTHHHHLLNVVRPDGTQDMPGAGYLHKQTLVAMDATIIVWRNGAASGWPESGEVYLGDVDVTQKGRPIQDQWPLVRYTMPANETRLVLRVPLIAGRAFAGARHPVVVHHGPPGIEINPRLSGYVLPH